MESKVNLFWYGSDNEDEQEVDKQDTEVISEKKEVDVQPVTTKEKEEESTKISNKTSEIVEKKECEESKQTEKTLLIQNTVMAQTKEKQSNISTSSQTTAVKSVTTDSSASEAANWVAVLDNNTNRYYYWNQVSYNSCI